MVQIAPFKAFRKKASKKVDDISKFICPPYDVISPDQRKALVQKSKTNVVQLELPAGNGDHRYRQAGRTFRQWKASGVVQQDRDPSYYLLETTFRVADPFAPRSQLKRYGVLVALGLETPGKGRVRPHEKTLPKAKQDRLKLFKHVQAHISPIFGLFFDSKKEWGRWVKKATRNKPLSQAKESASHRHRLWKIDSPDLQRGLQKALKSKELYIADGHHRYEVSWAFKEMRLKGDRKTHKNEGWQHVMTYICPMEEKGLLMLPTHRFVKTKRRFESWKKHLEPMFEIKRVSSVPKLISSLLKANRKERVLGWVTAHGPFVLKWKKSISINRCLAHRPSAVRNLDVVLLHDLILNEANGATYTKDKDIFFTQDVQGMLKKAKQDPSWVGFVLRSAGVEALAHVASAGEVMPPKTTYFYPKVPTGFTLMPLDQKIY